MAFHRFIVLTTAFLCNAVAPGYLYGSPRLLVPLLDHFRASRTQASLVPATLGTVICVIGVVAGPIIQRFGPKASALVGTVLMAVPIGLSFFATSVLFLIFTHAVSGVGCSLVYISCSRVLPMVFHGRAKHAAISCTLVGVGVGGMMYSYVVGILVDTYGLRGAFLFLSGLMLNGVALVLTWPGADNSDAKRNSSPNTNPTVNSKMNTRDAFKSVALVLRDKSFALFSCCIFFGVGAGNAIMYFISDVMVDQNYSPSLALLLFNLASNVGRGSTGVLKQIPGFSALVAPFIGSAASAIGSLLFAMNQSEAVMLLGSALIGLNLGTMMASVSIVSSVLVGDENMATGVGVGLTLIGIANLVAAPAVGLVRDTTGSYTIVFLFTTAMAAVASMFMLASIWARRWTKSVVITPTM